MRRKERLISQEEAYSVLDFCDYGVFATIDMETGAPYCIPVSPVRDGDHIYFHCAVDGQKLDNLKHDPRVCLTCAADVEIDQALFTTRYRSAVFTGRASLIMDPEEKRRALLLLCKKYSPDFPEKGEAEIRGAIDHTAVCRIDVVEVTGKCNQRRERKD